MKTMTKDDYDNEDGENNSEDDEDICPEDNIMFSPLALRITELLEFECNFSGEGCKVTAKKNAIQIHGKGCNYQKNILCPAPICKTLVSAIALEAMSWPASMLRFLWKVLHWVNRYLRCLLSALKKRLPTLVLLCLNSRILKICCILYLWKIKHLVPH